MSRILICEISGKRPGGVKQRPTERFTTKYDHLIISNNSNGYDTAWDIVNVPDDYVEWYKENVKTSDNAWYAPMNRSYAIKYARENGYDYLIQADDNIKFFEIAYKIDDSDGVTRRYRRQFSRGTMDDIVEMLTCVLENTNAGMAGCGLASVGGIDGTFLSERYCYSFFALDLKVCPDIFHGDFEDDIEYRLKLAELGLPSVMCVPLRYSKIGQKSAKDESGNRAAYTEAGLKRGEHMRILHGDVYSCGYAKKTATVTATETGRVFRHKIKPFKVGVMVKNKEALHERMGKLLRDYAEPWEDGYIMKEKRLANNGKAT